MTYSDHLLHFLTKDPPPVKTNAEQHREIAQQTAEYEARCGPVKTEPIRPVPKQRRLSKKQTRVAMRKRSFAEQVEKRQRRWVKGLPQT